MNSHTSPCDHMSLLWPRALLSIHGSEARDRPADYSPSCHYKSPAGQEISQLHHQENPSTTISGHQEVNPRASSSSSTCMASSRESSRKRGREEDDDDERRWRQLMKEGTAMAHEEPRRRQRRNSWRLLFAPALTAGQSTCFVKFSTGFDRWPFISGPQDPMIRCSGL
jgi:hypothetical protein